MDNFVTIKTFTYATEVAVIRGRLESEGIECFAQDELTVQANPFYSNAIGGVKLQVKQSDLRKAIEILEEGGYLKEADFLPTPLYTFLDQATAGLPYMRDLRLEFRLLIIAGIIVSLIMLFLCISYQPISKRY
jgi:hypothetical protein